MIEADFEGGSMDEVEDALEQLDKACRPYVMFLLSTMNNGRVVTHLTPNSKILLQNMYEDGTLSKMLEDALFKDE